MRKRITIDERVLKQLLENRCSVSAIARKMGVSRYVIEDRIRCGNGSASRHMAHAGVAPEEFFSKAAFQSMYESGLSSYAIAGITGVPKPSVLRILKRCGTKMRSRNEAATRYAMDHRFFSVLSEASCYWAGFFAADGCVVPARQGSQAAARVIFGLKRSDEKQVEKFKHAISYTGPLYRGRSIASVTLVSSPMADDLARVFKIVPRKSLILRPPVLPCDMRSHFIRGYIDGDGCWQASRAQVDIVGTRAMMRWILRTAKEQVPGIGNPSVLKKGKCFTLSFGGRLQVAALAAWLYERAETVLPRKLAIAFERFHYGGS
jgi:hypothetical protein